MLSARLSVALWMPSLAAFYSRSESRRVTRARAEVSERLSPIARNYRLVFLFGFAKRDRANIDQTEKQALLELGNVYMAMSEKDLSEAIRTGTLLVVACDGKEKEQPTSE